MSQPEDAPGAGEADAGSEQPAFVRDVVSGRLNGVIVNPETGDRLDAVFKDPTEDDLAELEQLEQQAKQGETEADRDFGNKIIDEFWLEAEDPETGTTYSKDELGEASDYGTAWKQAVTIGFLKAVGADNEALRDAEEFFDERLDKGGNE